MPGSSCHCRRFCIHTLDQAGLAAAAASEPTSWQALATEEAEARASDERAAALKGKAGGRSDPAALDFEDDDGGGGGGGKFESYVKHRVFASTTHGPAGSSGGTNGLWSSGVSAIRHWR